VIIEILHFFGKAICHQIKERSLLVSGVTLSVCARDTGIYLGIFSTLVYLILFKRNTKLTIPSTKVSFFLLLFMVPMMVDGIGSYSHLFESNSIQRLVTGIGFGYVLPYFLYPLLSAKALEHNSEPVVKHRNDITMPMLLCSILGVLVYWGKFSYYFIDSLIILTIIVWFSLWTSFLFSVIRNNYLKWSVSIIGSLTLLSMFSILHDFVIS
jgi:uncharacterized membrane protein